MSRKHYLLTDDDFDRLRLAMDQDPERITNAVRTEADRQKWAELWRIMNYAVVGWIQEMKK